jgi:hypothetical protein
MIHTAWHLATRPQHAHLGLRQWAHMLGFRGHFSTPAHLRAERTTWQTRRPDTQTPTPAPAEPQAGQTAGSPVGDRAGHPTDPAAGHRPGHRNIAGQRVDSDTTLVISHWQYAGTGLLAATGQTRPEQPTRTRSVTPLIGRPVLSGLGPSRDRRH